MSKNSSSVGAIRDAAALLGKLIDDSNIANGRVLEYNSSTGKLEYVTPSGGGGVDPVWTPWTPVILNGGTLTYTISNPRYMVTDKRLYAQFDFVQTNAGTGTADLTIAPPGGVTLLDGGSCGIISGLDIGNDNVYSTHGLQAFNAFNYFKFKRTGTSSYFKGGSLIGNNGNGFSVSILAAIA